MVVAPVVRPVVCYVARGRHESFPWHDFCHPGGTTGGLLCGSLTLCSGTKFVTGGLQCPLDFVHLRRSSTIVVVVITVPLSVAFVAGDVLVEVLVSGDRDVCVCIREDDGDGFHEIVWCVVEELK